jgi:hypothetical protein
MPELRNINDLHHLNVLDISTAHFNPLQDEKVLQEKSTMSSQIGYLVYVGGEEGPSPAFTEDASDGLRVVLEEARKAGYDFVLFDRDSQKHPALPLFDEEWEQAQVQ